MNVDLPIVAILCIVFFVSGWGLSSHYWDSKYGPILDKAIKLLLDNEERKR